MFWMMWPLFFNLFFKRKFDNDHVMGHRLLVSGSSPTHQWADISFEISRSLQTAMSGTSPIHQQVNTRSQNQSPATSHDRSCSAHQRTITSPGTPRALNQLPLNPGLPVSRCHLHIRQGLATNLTGSQPLLWDQPLSQPKQQDPGSPIGDTPRTQSSGNDSRVLCTQDFSHSRSLLQGQKM